MTPHRPEPPAPLGLLAELTHRCPQRCPYCSNPIELQRRSAELDTETWLRVFGEAAELGVLQLHLSGGEPTARADIVALTEGAVAAGLYTNLITSGIGVGPDKLAALVAAGLDHLQLSIQDVDPDEADRVAGLAGAHRRKRELARAVAATGLAFTVNIVIHRGNIARIGAMMAEAADMGAGRIEVAHAQYYGWGLANRAALMPSGEAAREARAAVESARAELGGRVAVDYVPPDYLGRYPKPCMNGWGRRVIVVTPDGTALPCHAAATITHLSFWNVRDRALADIWTRSPSFNTYRGTDFLARPVPAARSISAAAAARHSRSPAIPARPIPSAHCRPTATGSTPRWRRRPRRSATASSPEGPSRACLCPALLRRAHGFVRSCASNRTRYAAKDQP